MAVKKKYDKSVLGRGLDDIATGKGLDALISTTDVTTGGSSALREIAVEQIEPNPDQPRREFSPEALQELASSIGALGLIAPITLREIAPGHYQIIAGERRWRASQMAGLKAIPAYVRTVEDEHVMEMALVENIQREDLNAIEIALAYEHLAQTTGMTQEKISERVGKSRTAVTNYMRLLKLPAQIQMALKDHRIDMGHARALLALDSPTGQLRVFKDVVKNGWSVRKVEQVVGELKNGKPVSTPTPQPVPQTMLQWQDRVGQCLGAKVKLSASPKGKGKLVIAFNSEEELKGIIEKIAPNNQ